MVKTDLKDRKILTALDMDARMPLTQLAKLVGLSRQVVEYRIKRMQKENLILGARAIFDSVVAGYNWYRVLFQLQNVTKEKKDAFITILKASPHMLWLGEVGGNWDLIMNFIVKDNFSFNAVFEQLIAQWGAYIKEYEVLIYINVHDHSRAYILPDTKERKEFFHEMRYNPLLKLDDLDRNIIKELSNNAWLTNVEVGQKLGVSNNTIRNRLEVMESNKFLLGYRLFIHPSALGYKSHMLFLGINRLDMQREKMLHAYLRTIPYITFVVTHIGRWRIGIEIETQNEEEFQQVFVDIRGRFSDIITDFESFPIFRDHVVNYFPEGNL
ncbi:Lrp/AsnC family transcriptional regulator [Candidatus Woesearchaeota archaeon]|nr:Lrp/AsnC family transcriptional regulator [Candidatus Woesearchaeota archaeon]